jgi:hypothetical protein
MGIFDRLAGKSGEDAAIKDYVVFLPPQIERDHGIRYEYNASQIKTSVMRANLPLEHLILGYAMFLPRDKFDAVNLHGRDYDELHAKLQWKRS